MWIQWIEFFEGTLMGDVLFGKLGLSLLLATLALVLITAIALPTVMNYLQLAFPAKWAEATCIVVQVTIGSWVGTVAVSIARVAIWLRAVYAQTTMEEYAKERKDVTYVRDFNLWFLGIMTALATYMTLWLSK
jgi:polyferredoxin